MKTRKYILPNWAVAAMVNSDYTGLTDDEVLLIDDFVAEQIQSEPDYNCFVVTCPEGDHYFSWTNDLVRGMGGDVYEVEVIVKQ